MSLLERITLEQRAALARRGTPPAEQRTLAGVPWRPWTSYTFGYRDAFGIGGPRSPSEAALDEDGILGLSAVWGCVRHICDSVASLPIRTYRVDQAGTAQLMATSALLGSPVGGGGPQVTGTLYDWIFEATAGALLHGSCFGLITNRSGIPGPDGLGLPTGVAWLPPDRVYVHNDETHPEDPRRARIYYMGALVPQENLVHLKALPMPGHFEGLSPLRAHAATFATGRAQQRFAKSWFEVGGFPVGAFRNESEEVDERQSNEIKRRLTDALLSHQPLVYGSDWTYTPMSVPADEAQFVTSQQLTATQVAAIFGVPPWRVGGMKGSSLTYSSQVQDAVDELQNTIRPWLVRWEHLLTSMMPATQYAKFDADAFLKTDPQTRQQIHVQQRATGERTVNELRQGDDLAPIKGGDDPIPGDALVGMLRSVRAVPRSYLPLVELASDAVADRLQELAADSPGLVGSTGKPPVPMSAEDYLGAQITAGRKAAEALAELRARRAAWDCGHEHEHGERCQGEAA